MNRNMRILAAALAPALSASTTFAATQTWIGGSGALASTGGNWDSGSAPVSGDAIVFDATGRDHPCTWDLDIEPASWTQDGYTNVVTIQTVYDAAGFDCLEIAGDVILNSGIWTHQNNTGSARTYRLYVSCGGDMTIGAAAKVDVSGLGYRNKIAIDGHSDSGTQGGTYGGHGGMATAQETWSYGSLFAPEEPGNAGNAPSGSDCSGGGAVRLDIAGHFTHNGAIMANGVAINYAYYSGAGGSILVKAASISGTGTLAADAQAVDYGGGGGRIAVILSGAGADFANYDIKSLASCISLKPATNAGGCGTIYAETAADEANHGWLILKGNGTYPSANALYNADPFGSELATANFAKISILGQTKLCVKDGCSLDVTGTAFDVADPAYGIVLNGGQLCAAQGESVSIDFTVSARTDAMIDIDALTLASGATLASDHRLNVTGSLTVGAGAKVTTVTTTANVPTHKVDLVVGGDMTIAEGGAVDVCGRGYSKGYRPGGTVAVNGDGGSHGGQGRRHDRSTLVKSSVPPYGSIVNPTTHGSSGGNSGNTSAGGGVAILNVAGLLTVDGTITADSGTCTYYPGAGGSVNITAGTLAGAATGVITANGAKATGNNYYAAGGGGRIAIRLTGTGSDFSGYLGAITAYSIGTAAARCGGAGTIYLQTAAQGEGGGSLVIKNGTATTALPTPIGGSIEGTSFGDVTISNGAIAELADDTTMTVAGNFSNTAKFNAGGNSTVIFTGSGAASISGNTTFCNLNCFVDGKTLAFAAGSTTTVTGLLYIAGSASPVTLASDTAGSAWTLAADTASVSLASVQDCTATHPVVVVNGTDLGDNVNVIFQSVAAGTATWTGAAGTRWSDPLNWDVGRVPLIADTVVIPATATSPVLDLAAKVGTLTIASGATLNLGGKQLEVVGDLTVAGRIPLSAGSRLVICGDAAQTVSAASVSVDELVLLGAEMTLSGSYTCSELAIGDGATAIDCAFAASTQIAATRLTVNGSAASPNITLHPSAANGTWAISVSDYSVTGAAVSGSDASGGVAIAPVACVDNGGNVNWLFNDTRLRWTGANGTAFADDGNWLGGVAPTAQDEVVIEGAFQVAIDAATSVASLTVGGGATVTANAALAVSGSITTEADGHLVLNRPVTVGGSFTMLDGATLTHDVNYGTEANKIDITAAGGGLIASGAKINAKGKGFYAVSGGSTYQRGPGTQSVKNINRGASHGGVGYRNTSSCAAVPCYGSITNPVAIGSGGGWGGNGGGAVILKFGGPLRLDGEIDADAENSSEGYYSSSGGSVNIVAASLSGTGSAHAGGGTSGTQLPGAGGRVAVRLTSPGTSLGAFQGTLSAYGGIQSSKIGSSAGTVFTMAADAEHGRVTIANHPTWGLVNASTFSNQDKTDFPATQDNDPEEVARVDLVVGRYGTLNLTADAKVSSLSTVSTSAIKLNGHKLTVRSRRHAVPGTITPGTNAAGNPGEIVFDNGATLLLFR